jgi:hypothetical protein
MTTTDISFHCPECHARIKSPVELGGRRRHCPRCRQALTVPRPHPEAVGAVMVLVEEQERFVLALARRADATPVMAAGNSAPKRSA